MARLRRPSAELRLSQAPQANDGFYEGFNGIVRAVTLKEAAYLADASPSQFSNCCARRNRDHLRIELVTPVLEHEDVTQEQVIETFNPIVGLKNLQVVPIVEMTPEEELALTKAAIAKLLHPDIQALVVEHVKARGR